MTHDACPTCAGMKFAQRLVCSACWTRVPQDLKHEWEHVRAFSPARQVEASARILTHLRDQASGIRHQGSDNPNQLALL
jgi:hypothetical protein